MAQRERFRRLLLLPPSPARLVGGIALALAGPAAATALSMVGPLREITGVLYVFAVVGVALVGRLTSALVAAGASMLLFDYYELGPGRSLTLATTADLAALLVFGAVAMGVSHLLARSEVAREEAEEARERLAFLATASDVLGASLDYERTLDHLARLAVRGLADWCAVDLLEDDGSIRNVAVADAEPSYRDGVVGGSRYPKDPSVRRGVRQVLRTGRSELYPTVPAALLVEAEGAGGPESSQESGDLVSVIVAPLSARGRTFGALTLVARGGRRYGPEDLRLAEGLAERAALAIENARLHRAEGEARVGAERAAERTSILQRVTAELSGALTVEEIGQVLVQRGARAIGASAGLVAVLGEDRRTLEVVAMFGHRPEALEPWKRFPLEAPLPLAEAVREGRPVVLVGVEERDRRYPLLAGVPPHHDHSLVCLPMVAWGRAVGGIAATFPDARAFEEEELELMMAVARQGAQALERARVFAERDRVARTLQRSLLPPELPEIEGIELAASYLPLGEANEVGGDFYDVFPTAEREWALMIGDVCGKGPEAAALTGLIRNTVRATAPFGRRPSEVLGRLNEALLPQMRDQQFCTVCYARVRIDPRGPGVRVTVSSAGHPLPLVVRAAGGVEAFGRPGQLLGVFESPRLADAVTDLASGDLLLLYTDGLLDPRAWGTTFVMDKLLPALELPAGGSAAEVVDRIVGLLSTLELHDDVAVVALRVAPAG